MLNRKRKIIWFNPYNQNMSTNIAKIFLKLVEKSIKKHTNFIQNKKNKTTLSCNCPYKNGCPLNGNFRTENVIHKYTSQTKNKVKKVYLRVSEREFSKNRYCNHQQSLRNENYKNGTTLSTYL